MAQLKFGSPAVSAREIDLSAPLTQQPVGVPAGVIGTSLKGPAFVPLTVGVDKDFYSKFGLTDGKKFGPLAAVEWLRNAPSLTYVRVLGVGNGAQRLANGDVTNAGFTVGEQEPLSSNAWSYSDNPYANLGGALGRTYVLGCFMSESAGSTVFSGPGVQTSTDAIPIVRGLLMAASGVILTLSSSEKASVAPSSTAIATDANGFTVGSVALMNGSVAKQDFVLLLNGLKGTDAQYPNVITASFDLTSPNYFANVLNTDPYKMQQAGHYLYSHWDVHPSTAAVTGSGVVTASMGAGAATTLQTGHEAVAFILTGSTGRDVGSATSPNYEDFRDRFSHAKSPWVISQKFGGNPQNLFRIHSLDAGEGISTLYKISIENIALSTDSTNPYPTFDLTVRQWDDVDQSPQYLEQWRGLSLDPSDDRYIAKVIGDQHAYFDFDRSPTAQKLVIEGNYPNSSNYIRVEMDATVDAGEADPTAMPVGVRGLAHLVTLGTAPLAAPVSTQVTASSAWTNVRELPVPMRENITQGTGAKTQVNSLLYWGYKFEHVTSLSTPNLSTLQNESLNSMALFYPEHRTDVMGVIAGDNSGTPDTTANGVIDCDRFNNNMFTLMNLKVVTGSSGIADANQWVNATYVRGGNISVDDTAKTRALTPDDFVQANRRFLKWTFMLQGGFDGTNIFDKDQFELNGAAVDADMTATNRGYNLGSSVSAYKKAIDIMGEATNTDIQVLATPGIRNPVVTDYGIAAVEGRYDAMYVMDIEQVDNSGENVTSDTQTPSVTLTVEKFLDRSLDNSFAAAYFPDVVMKDPNTNTNVIAPPSVAVMGALALNDAVGHPWFAPAGFARGALQSTVEARVFLSKNNMDALYDANINPIVAFPGNATGGTNPKGGVLVWGQKTLQQKTSALNRVNVRRLLIEIRRQVKDVAMSIIFEPNREATLAKFSALVTPKLQKIQAQSGLQRFKVVIDSSTTTQQDVENNTIRGVIIVQPLKSIEYVELDFVVTNNLNQVV